VRIWEADRFLKGSDLGPPSLIPLEDLVCSAIRDTVDIKGQKSWVTVLREKVSPLLGPEADANGITVTF
jgi:hypothetical protein